MQRRECLALLAAWREGARSLSDGSQFPDMILAVLAVRCDRLRWQAQPLEALLRARCRGLARLNINREDAMRRIAAWRGRSVDAVRASFAGLELPGVAGNCGYFGAEGRRLEAPDPLDDLSADRYLPRRGVT